MTIGILGGTFDPIHIGHLWLAQEVGMRLQFSKVLFVPSRIPPHKTCYISELDRLEMVKLAIADNPFFELCTIEIDRPQVSYTIHTLELLQQLHPEPLAFIIGSDNLQYFSKWYQWERILEICDVVVGERPGANIDILDKLEPVFGKQKCEKLRQNFIAMPTFNISSSDIRERYAQKKSNKYLVPTNVDNYILDKQLYLVEDSKHSPPK